MKYNEQAIYTKRDIEALFFEGLDILGFGDYESSFEKYKIKFIECAKEINRKEFFKVFDKEWIDEIWKEVSINVFHEYLAKEEELNLLSDEEKEQKINMMIFRETYIAVHLNSYIVKDNE